MTLVDAAVAAAFNAGRKTTITITLNTRKNISFDDPETVIFIGFENRVKIKARPENPNPTITNMVTELPIEKFSLEFKIARDIM